MTSTSNSIVELKELWALLFPGVEVPGDQQWALWHLRHDADIVRQGITELATKFRRLNGTMDSLYMAKFASSVMNRLSQERHGCRKEVLA